MAELNWQVVMAPEAWDKMWAYVDLLKGEVACFGYTELDEETRQVYIPEVFLVPQTASAAEVDFMTEGLPFAIDKAIDENKIDQLRFCVHSHGEFAALWSGTDEDMLRKVGSTGTPWFVSAIFNRKGESTARIDIFGDAGPFGRTQHVLKDLRVVVERPAAYEDARLAELDAYVTIPVKPYIKPAVKALNRPAGTNTAPGWKQDDDEPGFQGYYPTKMLDDSTVVITTAEGQVTIDLAEMPVESIMQLAQKLEWDWSDDSTGTRYYYDLHPDGELFYGVKSERFDPSYEGNAAESEYAEASF